MRSTRQIGLLLAVLVVQIVAAATVARAETDVMFFLGQKHINNDIIDAYLPSQLQGLFPLLRNDLGDAEQMNAFGIGVSYARPSWPVALAVDVLAASGDARGAVDYTYQIGNEAYAYVSGSGLGSLDVDTFEVDLGVRKFWEVAKSASLYLGAGPSWVQADFQHRVNASLALLDSSMMQIGQLSGDVVLVDDDDNGFGYWANAGVLWRLKRVSVAFDIRWSDAEVEMTNDVFAITNKFNAGGIHFGAMVGYQFGRRR